MLIKIFGSGHFRRWAVDRSAVVALVVAFCLPAFAAAAGVAVDLAQAYNLKTRLSAALDKAALAAGNTTGTAQQVQDRITAFLNANYPPAALGDTYDVSVITPSGTVDVSAHAKVKTVFMGMFGQDYMDVFAESIVKKEVSGLELVLVLDNTGSMQDPAGGGISKIDAAKTAANTLLTILYGTASNVPKLYVGVVPFSMDVNIGNPDYTSWANSDSYDWGPSPSAWQGCIESRYSSGQDVTSTPPTTTKYNKYYFACDASANPWRGTTSSNYVTTGDFSSATGWTVGGNWSVGSGVATKSASGPNITVNGTFSSATGWTLDTGWTIGSNLLTKVSTNIATNGDFTVSTGWPTVSGWTITTGASGKLSSTGSSAATNAITRTPSTAIINGHTYIITYTIVTRTSGSVVATVGNKSGTSRSAVGTYSDTLTTSSSTPNTIGITPASFKGSIDNISVVDITTTNALETPSPALVSGDQYEVIFTINSASAGSVKAVIGGTTGTARTSSGTYTQTLSAGAGTTIGFTTTDGFAGTLSAFTVRDLTDGSMTYIPAITSSANYIVQYTIVSSTAGTVQAFLGNDTACTDGLLPKNCGVGAINSAPGTYSENLYSPSGTGNHTFKLASNAFAGVIDNVKIVPVCGGSGPYTYISPLDNTQGPNKYCVASMEPMSGTKSDAVTKINSLTAQGSTMINLGMVWGWHMLDPGWKGSGLWSGTMASATNPGPLPLSYNTNGMNKAVILMTDGDNSASSQYSAYGASSSNITYSSCSYGTSADSKLNCKTRDVCNSMKAQNILIYTIALGSDLNSTSLSMLKNCATSPAYAFTSPTTDDLTATFTTIANQLNSLYIVY